MSDKSQAEMLTESTHETDGSQKIRTIIRLQHGSNIIFESSWKPSQDKSKLKKTHTSFSIGDLSISLPKAPTLLAHSHLIQKEYSDCLGSLSLTDRTDHSRKSVTRAYMVTRHDGVGVFLDPLSAAFWASDCRWVKEVSVNTAAFVLKADRNSVIESATASSRETWEVIDAVLSIISLATQLGSRVSNMGISIEELSAKSFAA
ncbi:MAG: hypothetical protein ACXADS_13715 [Candidatus Thorarchaeota archaeon]|jgi:hypothetical protein